MVLLRDEWWYSTLFILFLFLFYDFVFPAIAAIALLILPMAKRKEKYDWLEQHSDVTETLAIKENQVKTLENTIAENEKLLDEKEKYARKLTEEIEEMEKRFDRNYD